MEYSNYHHHEEYSKSSSEEGRDHGSEDQEEENQERMEGCGRSYECVFCKRGFTTAQALGGHMNIHRKDRAKSRPYNTTPTPQLSHHPNHSSYPHDDEIQFGYPPPQYDYYSSSSSSSSYSYSYSSGNPHHHHPSNNSNYETYVPAASTNWGLRPSSADQVLVHDYFCPPNSLLHPNLPIQDYFRGIGTTREENHHHHQHINGTVELDLELRLGHRP